MTVTWELTITVDGVDLEVTVEALCTRAERGACGFLATWGGCEILRVDHEGDDILARLSPQQVGELEEKALNQAQAIEDDRGYGDDSAL